MNNSVMIDSSVLIEYVKDSKTKLSDSLLGDDSITCYLNEPVISEFLFQHVKLSTNKAPATLQSSGKDQAGA